MPVEYGVPNTTEENTGNWAITGSPIELWDAVNEDNAGTDYITATGNNKSCRFGLTLLRDPEVHTNHNLKIVAMKWSAATRLTVDIYQGGVFLFHVGVIGFLEPYYTWQTIFDLALPQASVALITDYSALEVRIATNNFNPTNKGSVTYIELAIPGAPSQRVGVVIIIP